MIPQLQYQMYNHHHHSLNRVSNPADISADSKNIGLPQHHNMFQSVFNARHRMSYLIRNLMPASNYEARVQARNDHGWNKLSSVFHFSTRAEGIVFIFLFIYAYFMLYICLCVAF